MNMSYCRFQNTLLDLIDCKEAIIEDGLSAADLSADELRARTKLIKECRELLEIVDELEEKEENL